MKKIGLIGGMSWESTLIYYKTINEKIRTSLGGFHSCKCIIDSVDFDEIQRLQGMEDWKSLDKIMAESAKNLEKAGADLIILCTNTMHLCREAIEENISVPFLHIARATGLEIQRHKLKKVLLLGTKFTMEKDFYKQLLSDEFGIETIVPSAKNRALINGVIYNELVQGQIKETSKIEFLKIIQDGLNEGAQGIILGCTEIPLLIKNSDVEVPVFDTTRIHAEQAVDYALINNNKSS